MRRRLLANAPCCLCEAPADITKERRAGHFRCNGLCVDLADVDGDYCGRCGGLVGFLGMSLAEHLAPFKTHVSVATRETFFRECQHTPPEEARREARYMGLECGPASVTLFPTDWEATA